MFEKIFELLVYSAFNGVGIAIGTYFAQKAILRHFDRLEKHLGGRKKAHG